MYPSAALTLLTLLTTSLATPTPVVEERHIIQIEKRQADVNQLLQLASLAGITALPTNNPALLLSLGPLANSLASALPTPSVLSILLTAAPSGFVSQIVNNPAYASSFESQFSAGSSPSWFNGLPTDVRGYLHTYSGFGQIAGAAGAVKGAATGVEGGGSSATAVGGSATSSAGGMTMMTSTAMTSATMTASSQGGQGAGQSGKGGGAATSATAGGNGAVAARPTGVIAVGVMGVLGVLGVVAVM